MHRALAGAAVVLALATLVLAAGLREAAAGGAKPHLEKVVPESALPGGNVEVLGSNLEAKTVQEIGVSVGGVEGYVLEGDATRVRIFVPVTLKKGKHAIEITIGGERSNKIELEVLDESAREKKAADDAATETLTGTPHAKVITLDAPQAVFDRGMTAIRVGGQADLPDGCAIALALTLGSDRIDSSSASVQGQRFQAMFGPYAKQLYAGKYWVDASFYVNDQPKKIRDLFKAQFKDAKERTAHERGSDRQPCQVGTPDQEEGQAKELKGHVSGSVARLREMLKDLESAFGSAGRSAFRKGGAVDEAAWEEWLGKKALKSVPEADHPRRIREIRARTDFLTQGGAFAEPKWREWMDGKFRDELGSLAKAHAAYRERYLIMRDAEVMEKLGGAIDQLLKLSRNRSRELYERTSIPFSAQDPETVAVSAAQIEQDLKSLEKRMSPEGGGGK